MHNDDTNISFCVPKMANFPTGARHALWVEKPSRNSKAQTGIYQLLHRSCFFVNRVLYKLTDFGAARELQDEEQFMSLYGTEEYLVRSFPKEHLFLECSNVLPYSGPKALMSNLCSWHTNHVKRRADLWIHTPRE